MTLTTLFILVLLIFAAFVPAVIALLIAHKQKRSKFLASLITFFVGLLTVAGGWIYIGIMFLLPPKRAVDE